MSAETLRRAAALMRERAAASAAFEDLEGWWRPDPLRQAFDALVGEDEVLPGAHEDAEHIAAWHPAVALAVADLLDFAATHQVAFTPIVRPRLIAVARAYLGDDA